MNYWYRALVIRNERGLRGNARSALPYHLLSDWSSERTAALT